MPSVPWDDRPPADIADRLGVWVHRLKAGEEATYRLLGAWKGAWHHFTPRHSTCCLKQEKGCPLCPDAHRFWECYAPALRWDPKHFDTTLRRPAPCWKRCICPILPHLAADLSRLSLGVTGLVLTIRRDEGRRKLHHWDIHERTEDQHTDPAAQPFDVVPILLRMWRLFWHLSVHNGRLTTDLVAWEDRPQLQPPAEASQY